MKLSTKLKNWIHWKVSGGFTLYIEKHKPMKLGDKRLEFSEEIRVLSVKKVK